MPLTFEATRAAGGDARLGRDHGLRRDRRPRRHAAPDRPVLPRRVVRPVRAVPRGERPPGGAARPARGGLAACGRATRSWSCCATSARPCATPRSAGSARRRRRRSNRRSGNRSWWRCERGHAGPVDEPRPGARSEHATRRAGAGGPAAHRDHPPPARPAIPAADGTAGRSAAGRRADDRRRGRRRCRQGTTILGACRQQGIDTPTLCYAENLTPVNVCRVCVVEVTGSRVLVPACSRKVEAGMDVQTDSERVRTSRKVVLEFLGSSVDVSLAGPAVPDGTIHSYMERYGADPARYGPPAAPAAAGERDDRTSRATTTRPRATRRPRPSPSRRRSTTTSTSATTRSASSATSASRRAARTPRTRSRSPSPGAGSTPGSRPSRPSRCRSRRACTAATASASARRAR